MCQWAKGICNWLIREKGAGENGTCNLVCVREGIEGTGQVTSQQERWTGQTRATG